MSNVESFIEKYKNLEQIIRTEYSLDASISLDSAIDNDYRLKKDRKDLRLLRDIRNLLQHQEKIKGKYIIEPIPETLELLDNLIIKFKNKQRCIDYCIKKQNICYRKFNDNISDAIIEMNMNSYTHIPILDNDVVQGIFNENSIFNYLADNKIIEIDGTFEDIANYLSLNARKNEEYKFIDKNYKVEKLKQDIEDAKKRNKRLDIAFITENGKQTEKLLGLITIWDIINLE